MPKCGIPKTKDNKLCTNNGQEQYGWKCGIHKNSIREKKQPSPKQPSAKVTSPKVIRKCGIPKTKDNTLCTNNGQEQYGWKCGIHKNSIREKKQPSPKQPSPKLPSPKLPSPELPSPELSSPELPSPELSSPELSSPEVNTNIPTQEELDEYLFNNTSLDPTLISDDILHITYNNKVLEFKKYSAIGKGAYGQVFLFKLDKLKYALKFATMDEKGKIDNSEKTAILELQNCDRKFNRRCNIVKARLIENGPELKQAIPILASIMPVMIGDLDTLLFNVNSRFYSDPISTLGYKKNILNSIRSQMECIIHLNDREIIEEKEQKNFQFAYTDLKPSNILYKINDDTLEYEFCLGDLGSLIKNEDNEFISTFPIQLRGEMKVEKTFANFPNKHIVSCMRYVFGLFSYLLLTDGFNEFYKNINTIKIKNSELTHINSELVRIMGETYSNLIIDDIHHRTSMFN